VLCPTVAVEVVFALGDMRTIAGAEAGDVEPSLQALAFVGASGRSTLA
jgi:hypothetical protein